MPTAPEIFPTRNCSAAYLNLLRRDGALALVGASLEKFAVEIRHLMRTEVREAEEPFTQGQKGSSAMPHKRNPIGSENITGLARLLRGNALAAMENVALWHERDISHSSVERLIFPDACLALDYILRVFSHVIECMDVDERRMRENLDRTRGLVYSGRVLLALVDKGMARNDAYELVQHHAREVWNDDSDFRRLLADDPSVSQRLSPAELNELFSVAYHLRYVETAFQRLELA